MKKMVCLCLFLALFAATGEALAAREGLVRVTGSSQIYWVDPSGERHRVANRHDLEHFFAGESIRRISDDELQDIPLGRPISESTPPEYFDDDDDLNVRVDDSYGRWVHPPHDDGY
jgi:hypothetical protein